MARYRNQRACVRWTICTCAPMVVLFVNIWMFSPNNNWTPVTLKALFLQPLGQNADIDQAKQPFHHNPVEKSAKNAIGLDQPFDDITWNTVEECKDRIPFSKFPKLPSLPGVDEPPGRCNRYQEETAEFRDGVLHLLDLLPDEETQFGLQRPIQDDDIRKRIRQLSLKMRKFRTFFDAWKSVHVVKDQGGRTYLRDDIMNFLRCSADGQQNLPSLISRYETMRSLIRRVERVLFPWTSYYFPDMFTLYSHISNGERGIVTTAGNKQAPWLLTSVRTLRMLGCKLPIEVMYFGDRDLGPDLRDELERLPGVVTRNLKLLVNDSDWELKTFAGKPFAALFSSFSEVILIDADAVFFQNPDILFSDEDYLQNRALFFHDRTLSIEDRRLRFSQPVIFRDQSSVARQGRRWLEQAFPEPISARMKQSRMWTGESRQVQESGVVVVDKSRHFLALLVASWINGPGRRGSTREQAGFYDVFYGDKESYWIAWEVMGDTDYTFHPGGLSVTGAIQTSTFEELETERFVSGIIKETAQTEGQEIENHGRSITICAPQLLHHDRSGSPLWFNGWILKDKFDNKSQMLQDFQGYMMEPTALRDPEAWQIGDHNLACLTSEKAINFTRSERRILDKTIEIALAIGAYKPGLAPPPQDNFY